jgi:hypothetical protein
VKDGDSASLGTLPYARRILVPSLDISAPVAPLDLLRDKVGRSYYSQPKGSIGRIATAGNPGEMARGWYFGHIRSTDDPGEEFRLLPTVVDLMAQGQVVDVILETTKSAYLYRVSRAPMILSAEDFDRGYFHENLHAAKAEVVLVTCLTSWKPTHRLLVTAELVGVGPLN